MPTLLTFASGLFIAVITSLLTVWLALWRFHSEKWWERKAELYSKLIEALYDMYCYSSEWLDDYEAGDQNEAPEQKKRRKEKLAELLARHKRGEEEVQKIVVIGAFIVSDAVAADLMRFRKEYDSAMQGIEYLDLYDIVGGCKKSVQECLSQVREHAKEDLGITRKFSPLLEKITSPLASIVMKSWLRGG